MHSGTLLAALMGFVAGVCVTLSSVQHFRGGVGGTSNSELLDARRSMTILRQQLALAQRGQPAAVSSAVAVGSAAPAAAAAATAAAPQRWTDTPDHRRLHATLSKAANARGEVMVALANDVMMCTNRKTCWWNGGNVLETFLKGVSRLRVSNVVIITLDDETEKFCQSFHVKNGGAPISSLRLELPVPSAQQGSRGANMISTLKYGLLRQALLMGFAILVVDLDLVFLKDPFERKSRRDYPTLL